MLTWNYSITNTSGDDIMVALFNNSGSGTASTRLRLEDNTFTPSVIINYTTGVVTSTAGTLAMTGPNGGTTISTFNGTPAGKPLDISTFYTGALKVNGIEFSSFTSLNLDLLAVAGLEAAVLPVTLSDFTAHSAKCASNLTWKTAIEINSAYYEAEYSTNGAKFTAVGKVTSANSANGSSYTFTHSSPAEGAGFYRLKMVDFDGIFAYSEIVKLQSSGCGLEAVTVFPNPISKVLNLKGVPTGSSISIYDCKGAILNNTLSTIGAVITLPTSSYAPGVYFVRVIKNGVLLSSKRVIKK